MKVWRLSLLIIYSGSVLSEQDALLLPCDMDDIECLSKSTTTFLEKSHKGNVDYDFDAIDPFTISSIDVDLENDLGIVFRYRNTTITGLRNQKISDFKMNTATKSVVLTTKADVVITSDVTAEFTKTSKNFPGSFRSTASVLGTATYNYELKNDSKGVQHFEVGPETITCKVVTTTQTELQPELREALNKDEDYKKIPQEKLEELRSKAFCALVRESYKSVIHNIRSAARLLPASAFFNNIE